jgi:hypothetical protein
VQFVLFYNWTNQQTKTSPHLKHPNLREQFIGNIEIGSEIHPATNKKGKHPLEWIRGTLILISEGSSSKLNLQYIGGLILQVRINSALIFAS